MRNIATDMAIKNVIKKDLDDVRQKQKVWIEASNKVPDFEDSEEYRKYARESVEDTVTYFQQWEPDHYNYLVNNYGNDPLEYLKDGYFLDLNDYNLYGDNYIKAEKEFRKNHPEVEEEERLYKDYVNSYYNMIDNIFGEYGNKTLVYDKKYKESKTINEIMEKYVNMDKLINNV